MINPSSSVVSYLQPASLIASAMLLMPNEYIAPKILPVMPMDARQSFYYKETTGNWLNRIDTKRADGAAFARVNTAFSLTACATQPRGVEMAVPDAQREEFNPHFGGTLDDRNALQTMHHVLRDYEKDVFTILDNTTTYPTGTGTGFAASNTWASSSGSPITDINKCCNELAAKRPSLDLPDLGLVVTAKTARAMFGRSEIRQALGSDSVAAVPGNLPVPQLAEALRRALGLGAVHIQRSGYRSGGTETTPTITNDFDNTHAGVYILPKFEGTKFFSGLGVTLAWSAMAPAGADPLPVSVVRYRENPTQSEVLQISTELKAEIVNSDAWMLITSVNS